MQQMKLQHVARLECENLMVMVVCRFLYDWMHFSEELHKIMESVAWGNKESSGTVSGKKQPQYYRPIVEVPPCLSAIGCQGHEMRQHVDHKAFLNFSKNDSPLL